MDMQNIQLKKRQQIFFSLLMGLFAISGLLAGVYYLLMYPPVEKFHRVVTDDAGKFYRNKNGEIVILGMSPQVKPVATRENLLQWAVLAVTSANNYSASNYNERLTDAVAKYFTAEGGEAFIAELKASGILERILREKLLLTAVVVGAPVIMKQGMLNYGVFVRKYTWKIQMPLLISYQTSSTGATSTVEKKKFIVTLLVVEMPTWLSKYGIGIQQYLMTKA